VSAAAQAGSETSRAKNTMIRVVDGKISVKAISVPLAQLVKQLDAATNKNSRIKSDIATKMVSVRFEDLEYEEAVRKIFQGVALDYILVDDGLFVTGNAGAVSVTTSAASAAAPPPPQPIAGPPTLAPDNIFGIPPQPPPPGIDPFAAPAPTPPQQAAPAAAPPTPLTFPPPPDFNSPFSSPSSNFGPQPGTGAATPQPGGAPQPGPSIGLPGFSFQ
jgi:hypothetical protein